MSGLWRNLLTLLVAIFKRDSGVLQSGCSCTFWVTPFDVGISILKSDRYLQLAESAQLDFAVRSGLLGRMWRSRCAMVNSEQQIQFTQPIKLFDKVCVKTTIVFADPKFVHFQHVYTVRGLTCASVAVKAKFKSGRITQSAIELTEFEGLARKVAPGMEIELGGCLACAPRQPVAPHSRSTATNSGVSHSVWRTSTATTASGACSFNDGSAFSMAAVG